MGRFGLLNCREGGSNTEGVGAMEVDWASMVGLSRLLRVSTDKVVPVSSSDQVEH